MPKTVQGWLQKKNSKGVRGFKSWKKLWCCCDRAGFTFAEQSAEKRMTSPSKKVGKVSCIPWSDIASVALASEESNQAKKKKKDRFLLVTQGDYATALKAKGKSEKLNFDAASCETPVANW